MKNKWIVSCMALLLAISLWHFLPQDPQLHVVGVYEGFGAIHGPGKKRLPGHVTVNVKGNRPAVLVLSSYEPTIWNVNLSSNAHIERVILIGYYKQSMQGLTKQIPVEKHSHESNRTPLQQQAIYLRNSPKPKEYDKINSAWIQYSNKKNIQLTKNSHLISNGFTKHYCGASWSEVARASKEIRSTYIACSTQLKNFEKHAKEQIFLKTLEGYTGASLKSYSGVYAPTRDDSFEVNTSPGILAN